MENKFDRKFQVLRALSIVKYATIYNFQPWLSHRATSYAGSLIWPRKIFKILETAGYIQKIRSYGYGPTWSYNTFYQLTKQGSRFIGNEDDRKYIDPRSMQAISHQAGLIDIVLAFVYLYPTYHISVDYFAKFEIDLNKKYNPDAVIKLTSPDKVYHFIVEFERSRERDAIKKDKFWRNERMADLSQYGLNRNAKFLYVYTVEHFNVFWRPNQYDEPAIKDMIRVTEARFKKLLETASYLPDHRYRFVCLHNFTNFNNSVWFTPKGHQVSLINL